MNLFKTASAAALLLTSLSTFAVSFSSSTDDTCVSCTTQSINWDTYLDLSSTTELANAEWIQADGSSDVSANYSIFEVDFSDFSYGSTLTSLFVAYDDTLTIQVDGDVLFDSTTDVASSYNGWSTVTDVFNYIDQTYIAAGSTLDFYVTNTGLPNAVYGPSGVAWSGTVEVPEPSMVFALGLGLVAFGFKRRQNKNL